MKRYSCIDCAAAVQVKARWKCCVADLYLGNVLKGSSHAIGCFRPRGSIMVSEEKQE